jgi:hypothetical protein
MQPSPTMIADAIAAAASIQEADMDRVNAFGAQLFAAMRTIDGVTEEGGVGKHSDAEILYAMAHVTALFIAQVCAGRGKPALDGIAGGFALLLARCLESIGADATAEGPPPPTLN